LVRRVRSQSTCDGGGVLHFVLPGQALAAHDFSYMSAAVQSL